MVVILNYSYSPVHVPVDAVVVFCDLSVVHVRKHERVSDTVFTRLFNILPSF